MFGITATAGTATFTLRAFVGLLALSKTSLLSSTNSNVNNNGQRDPASHSIPTGWDDLLNHKICRVLEQQDLFHAHYAQLGNPRWKLDLQPSGACVLEFTDATTDKTVAKYNCRLVGSESNTAGTFLWAIPPDPARGVPHDLLASKDPRVTPAIQSSLFQTRQEIPLSPTVNGYSLALLAGALLEEPAQAVFLGPYGDDTGTLYLLITDTDTYPNVVDDRPKLERLKGFVSMAAEIPFITNHKVAFAAYAKDLGLTVTTDGDTMTVTDSTANDESLEATFDQDDNMKRLGDLMLMTTDELEAAKAAQAANQQQPQQQQPPGNPNHKCAQLQMQFFQKVLDETSVPNQRQLFLDVATALELQLSDHPSTAKEVEAWDPSTGEAAVGVFDDEHRMTQWRNVKKTA